MFGQYEVFDPGLWESYSYTEDIAFDFYNPLEDVGYDFYNPPIEDVSILEEWPSEARYVDEYIAMQEAQTAQIAEVVKSGSILDILKGLVSMASIATPVLTAALTSKQTQAAATARTAAAQQAAIATQEASLLPSSITSILSQVTSNLPLLAVAAIGGYFILKRK